jgi:hypothetical protein
MSEPGCNLRCPMIHAQCPGCHARLSIPSEWLNQAIRCTRCGMPVQAKAAAPVAAGVPVAHAASGVPMGLIPSAKAINRLRAMPPLSIRLGHGGGTVITPPRRRRRRNRVAPLVGWALTLGLLGAGGYVGFNTLIHRLDIPFEPEPVEPPPEPVQVKVIDTKDKGGKKDRGGDTGSGVKKVLQGPFPRRLLAIQISNYLYFNAVSYGPKARDGHVLVGRLARALQVPPGQVFELSDAAPTPRPPLRDTVLKAIRDFAATSRGQDRVVVLFSGHAIDVEGVPYLVPLDGEPGESASLVPLRDVFESLAVCKARQKVLILDTCRFDPARGSERPSGGAMTEAFEAAIAKPPAGVQVWTVCSAGQHSYEDAIVNGGVFMSALVDAVTPALRGRRLELPLQKQTTPVPIDALSTSVNRWTTDDVQAFVRRKQTPRLYGSGNKDGAEFDSGEPAAVAVAIPRMEGEFFAPKELVQSILRDTSRIPSVREGMQALQVENFPPFRNQVLRDYGDTASALRAPIDTAIATLVRHRQAFREEFAIRNIDQLKRQIVPIQPRLAEIKLDLDETLEVLERAAADRQKEKSPRWRANYDYAKARLLMRVAYVFEYQYMLAEIRTDALPELSPMHLGWRLASREKLQAKGEPGKEAKDRARRAREILEAMAKEHRGTPYEILAKRELATALGLEWQPLSPVGATPE